VAIASPTPTARAVRSVEVIVMASSVEEANAEVLAREDCLCGDRVDDDHAHKYIAAGGALAGPFCSRDCHYAFLLKDDDCDLWEDGGDDGE
jgi:predicted lactoylglutathione lyase